jgi:alkanesulfonate monooxygenase SsuD/methylene tetrahydromethanopterin reductase-like flavin-dependent oxidoreductase (luciferase family)
MTSRPFRFGAVIRGARSKEEWVAKAKLVEQLGYAVLLAPDHIHLPLAPIPALLCAALATTTLRVGSYVLDNDFRHPVILAKEAATLDVLSGGRFELGIGAGWLQAEYERTGISFDAGTLRVERLEEAVHILKGLFARGPVAFSGIHYKILDLEGVPKPLQQPQLPLLVGGASKRILSLAAREATIVSLAVRTLPGATQLDVIKRKPSVLPQQPGQALRADSMVDVTTVTSEAMERKIEWVRQAAGERFSQLELQVLVSWIVVTDDRKDAAQVLGKRLGMTAEQILASPYCLVGTIEQICSMVKSLREAYGISYLTVFEEDMEAFAPVVARLAGS